MKALYAAPAAFAAHWSGGYGFSGTEPAETLPVRSLQSRQRFDPAKNVHREYVTWSTPQGPFVVVYGGNDGTYQWNRPHFLDFLRHFEVK